MAFAGLHNGTHYTIITCEAAKKMANVHSRMPVILPPEDITAWLDGTRDIDDAVSLLVPFEGKDLLVTEDEPEKPQEDVTNNEPPQGDLFS